MTQALWRHGYDLAIHQFVVAVQLLVGPSQKLGHLHPLLGQRGHTHRSTSPNTMSSEPRIAEMSASRWPRLRKSMAWRWAKPGARILHLYGLFVPSATR